MSKKRTKYFSNHRGSRFQALLKDTSNEDTNTLNATPANTQQVQPKNTLTTTKNNILCNNSMHSKNSWEENTNPESHNIFAQRRHRERKNKKENLFDKHLEIVSKGIHKGTDKDQSCEKNKENMDHFLEEKSVEEILKVVQVDTSQVLIHNKHDGNFHGQTSNMEQLGPK